MGYQKSPTVPGNSYKKNGGYGGSKGFGGFGDNETPLISSCCWLAYEGFGCIQCTIETKIDPINMDAGYVVLMDFLWVIFVLNMEIIILECEIIGNPREFLPSNPVSNGVSQQTTMPSFNRSSAVKARVTGKGDLRRYNEVTGDGEVISFDLLDSDGGKIRMTRFNAQHGNVIAATKILRNATTSIFFNKEMEKSFLLTFLIQMYLLQCQVQDHTGLTWVTDFQEAGEEILGTSEAKIKEETYGDEQRLKVIVVKVDKMNYSSTTNASLSMLPWPKPTIWPSDASSEVLAKEK
ncbi:replication protein A 70 kDa DNA-binding subunit A, partial [Tanacetum coccineum]